MIRRLTPSAFIVLLLLSVCGARVFGQDAKLEELRRKYTWGSIYFAYDPICDLIYDLKNPTRLGAINSQDRSAVMPVLTDFLKRNMSGERVKSISFLQINLDTLAAGYMKANDRDGVIKPLPWSKQQVRDIAVLCDRILNGGLAFENLKNQILEGTISLPEAWISIHILSQDKAIPLEKVSLLLVAYRTLLEKPSSAKAWGTEFHELEGDNFRGTMKSFDSLIMKANSIWSEGLTDRYYENPYNNAFAEALKTRNGVVFDALDRTAQSSWFGDFSKAYESRRESVRLEAALGSYRQALTLDPNNAKIYELLAEAYLQENKPEQAMSSAQHALALDPNDAQTFVLMGRIYLQQENLDEAINRLKTALSLNEKLIDVHLLLARILIARDEKVEAKKHIGEALRLDPQNEEAGLLRCLESTSRFDDRPLCPPW